jgi:DNA-binding MarR family transcriptional regulator
VVADEHDKRNRLVALTEAGWAKIAQSHPLWEKPNTVSSARSARRGGGASSNIGLRRLAGVHPAARWQIIGALAMYLDLGPDAEVRPHRFRKCYARVSVLCDVP